MRARAFSSLLAIVFSTAANAATTYTPPDKLDDGWTTADAAKAGWNVAKFGELEERIANQTYKGITSVVVAQDDKLVYEHYSNSGGRDKQNNMRSATKTITALLVGGAIDRKLIPGVDAKVYAYFPDKQPVQHPDKRKDAFTIEDLLTMSSLWECNDENEYSSGHEERMYISEDWLQFALGLPIKGFPPWESKPKDSPYGRSFSYCTAGAFVLGAIVERAVHKHLDAFFQEAIGEPLGIASVKWGFAPDGTAMGVGGTEFRSRDLVKVGQMMIDSGKWQGKQVLSAKWIEAMTTVHAQARDDAEYGYLIWRFHYPLKGKDQPVWAMAGNGGNYLFLLPERHLVAIVTSTAYNQKYAHPQSQEIFRDFILAALP